MKYLVIWNINGQQGWKKAKTESDAGRLFNELNNNLSPDDYLEIIDVRKTHERPEYIKLKNAMESISKLSSEQLK